MRPSEAALRWCGAAAVLGGAMLIARRLWDYFGRGRVLAHTGYPERDLSDFLFFLVPLLMVIAFAAMWRAAGGPVRPGRTNLAAGALGGLLQALGEFGEAWHPHGMTWGSLGGAGFLLMGLSLLWLGLVSLRRNGISAAGLLPLFLGLMVPLQLAAVMLPYNLWGDRSLSARCGLAAAVVYGLGWMALGGVLGSFRKSEESAG